MSIFLRMLQDEDKASALAQVCERARVGDADARVIQLLPEAFNAVPGKPFAYWVSDAVRETFQRLRPFEGEGRTVRVGLQTSDDFRFVRGWWEASADTAEWIPFAKGGAYSPFYADVYLVVNWARNGAEIEAFSGSFIRNSDFYFRSGITWPLRARRFSPQALPSNCIFSVRGYCAFPEEGEEPKTLAIFGSTAFDFLFKTALGRFGYPEFIVGMLQIMPWIKVLDAQKEILSRLAGDAWFLKRTLDTVEENSHAFLLPAVLRARLGAYDPPAIEVELARIQTEIDDIAFDLYGFSPADRAAALGAGQTVAIESDEDAPGGEEDEADEAAAPVDDQDALRSWAIGVAFGRFDWRLATGEREAPPEPEPFDPLPAKSPGMLPDGAAPFHTHPGILADDPGHPHDLTRLTERVLERVGQPVPPDLRRWLQREFFPFHLQRYSKSRRKAPLYWPLATPSGSYTLWLYYPDLSSQTLYTAVNDFLDGPTGKLAQVTAELTHLRAAGSARSRDDERRLETLTTLDTELRDLRDTLFQIAPTYQPNHDDGVQITAAPLWPLFRHRPWQKLLKETWTKLEKGDYDWAHLAMAYWPQRVREKCKTDKSLAIAHGLEDLYIEPEAAPKKTRGRKKKTST